MVDYAPTSGLGVPVVHQIGIVVGPGLVPDVFGLGRRQWFDGDGHMVFRVADADLRTGWLSSHYVRGRTNGYAFFFDQHLRRIIRVALYIVVVRLHRVLRRDHKKNMD